MSDNKYDFDSLKRVDHCAKFALVAIVTALASAGGCSAYMPATATQPVKLPWRGSGRLDAMEAAMRAAAKHQELTVLGPPRIEGEQTTFMLMGTGGESGVVVVTRVGAATSGGEGDVVVTADVKPDPSQTRAGRLVADFLMRWEQLRATGFAPLPSGWQ